MHLVSSIGRRWIYSVGYRGNGGESADSSVLDAGRGSSLWRAKVSSWLNRLTSPFIRPCSMRRRTRRIWRLRRARLRDWGGGKHPEAQIFALAKMLFTQAVRRHLAGSYCVSCSGLHCYDGAQLYVLTRKASPLPGVVVVTSFSCYFSNSPESRSLYCAQSVVLSFNEPHYPSFYCTRR